jgi:LPS export ABC transporter permease LptF/LPS export ABC transporter permease LptG
VKRLFFGFSLLRALCYADCDVRILTKYILREVLWHALIGTGLFTFVIFMRDVGRILELVVRNSAPLPSVAEIFLFTVPQALTVTMPMGVLVGILIGLSRLAADSEVTAMRASGLGAGMFLKVVSIFAVTAWLLASGNQLYVAPRASASLARLQDRLKSSQASYEVQPRVFYEDFKNYVLYVQDASAAPNGALWKGIFLADISTPGAPKITLAQRGIVSNQSPTALRLHLINGTEHDVDPKLPQQYQISTFEASDISIPVPEPETPAVASSLPAAARQGLHTPEIPTSALWRLAHADDPTARWFDIELHRRFALPTACLVLALVGIPLGLSAKKGGKSTGFILTILLVFVYYFAYLTGVALARQGRVPPAVGVWMANVVFFFAGAWLLWRVDRMPMEIASLRPAWVALKGHIQDRTQRAHGAFRRAVSRRRFLNTRFPQILDDYILRDFLTYLGMILAMFIILSLVFTFFELLGDIVRNRVPLVTVGAYMMNVVPGMLYLMTPLSVLIAVLVTFGLMQKANEITAMKATGISIYRAVVPVLLLAALLPVALFFFDQYWLPQANKRQDQLWNAIKGRPAQTYLRPDRKWIFGQRSTIYYYEFFDPDRNHFGSISVFEFDPATFEFTRRVYATRARWAPELQKWVFEDGWERGFHGAAIRLYRTFDVATFAELGEAPPYFKKEVKQSSEMNYDELSRYITDLQQSGFDVVRLRVQLQKKFAFPLITFVMAVLAIPFALSTGRRGALAGVATAIGIAVVYWVTSGLFEAMGNVSQLPAALAAWAPDVIFGFAGGYMILKVPT